MGGGESVGDGQRGVGALDDGEGMASESSGQDTLSAKRARGSPPDALSLPVSRISVFGFPSATACTLQWLCLFPLFLIALSHRRAFKPFRGQLFVFYMLAESCKGCTT